MKKAPIQSAGTGKAAKDTTCSKTISVAAVEVSNIPIDERVLKKMFGDDPDFFKEILNDFIVHTQKTINEIKAGWRKHSAEEVEQAAHKLKSSAKSVGANELGDICIFLEAAGREEDWKTIEQNVLKLDVMMNEVERYIKNL